jgi:membrane protease YdiL (CAAX protease family)
LKHSAVNSIAFFFFLSLIQIFIIAGLLIFGFSLKISDLTAQKNIPETAKLIYFISLYIFLLINLFLLDSKNFTNVFKISKKKIIFLFSGFLISSASLIVLYSLENTFNLININTFHIDSFLLIKCFILSLFVAIIEELVFRNFIFRKLFTSYSLKTSLIASSYIYGQLHFLKFDLKPEQILIPLTGLFFIGMILAYSFYKFDIWLSIGLHMGWVILISYTNQSGSFIPDKTHLLLTGGLYPIGGILGNLIVIILFFIFLIFSVKLSSYYKVKNDLNL